ncbi:hypothetical protein IQ250_12000 [Pseudanabaenaceae cyanobacterium LEGE 13415]|nr:hypothetical protein [Pseudanabaenaceae cyanobacterium LEGE 13415]
MSHRASSKVWKFQPATQAKFRLLVVTLTFAVLVGSLFPQVAKAGVLDGLSNTIEQTVERVTNNATNPVRQIEGAIGQVENTIQRPLDGINNTIQSLLSPFVQQLQQYFQVFNHTFQDLLSSVFSGGRYPWDEQPGGGLPSGDVGNSGNSGDWSELPPADSSGAIYGPLQIPDFLKSHKAIDQQVLNGATAGTPSQATQTSDRFNINPVPLAQSLRFQQDRLQSYGMAATVLSTEGQTALKQEMQAATATLQTIQQKSQEAQSMDVTQDAIKNLTAIQANQSSLVGGSYAQLMALRAQDAANAVVTSNISETLDEENRARHAESMAAADHVLRASAGIYLPGLVK